MEVAQSLRTLIPTPVAGRRNPSHSNCERAAARVASRQPISPPWGVFDVARLVVAVAVLLLVVPASAGAKTKRQVETGPVQIGISADTCSKLPAGTEITGAGTQTSITWTTRRAGRTSVTNSTVATGTATDQAGNQSTWVYSNQFWVANTRANTKRFRGPMVDAFQLSGATRLSNGFLARFSTDFDKFNRYKRVNAFGDPIEFPAGVAHCDPL
jgi:hypothetical protein